MATYKQIIQQYSKLLRDVTHIPIKETQILLLSLLDKNQIWLHLHYDDICTCEKKLLELVKKRATSYPLEYITQQVSFYGENFKCEEGVLIPRSETEILIDKALDIIKQDNDIKTILEIGSGSGIITITLANLTTNIDFVATDINPKALKLSKQNAQKFQVEDKITFIESNLFENIKSIQPNMIISNPPYIPTNYKLPKNVQFEPKEALFANDQGSEILKQLISYVAKNNIKYLLCEMGYDQKKIIEDFIATCNIKYKSLEFYKDLANFNRGFVLQLW